ncbi:Actin-related protein 2/3 complex subunit 2A, partial [Zostera marina]
ALDRAKPESEEIKLHTRSFKRLGIRQARDHSF